MKIGQPKLSEKSGRKCRLFNTPIKREQGLSLSDADLRLKQTITVHYLLVLHFRPFACDKIA
jgi:hypothetical protein